jgi:hypothetical protein
MSTQILVKNVTSLTPEDVELEDWHLLRAVAFQKPELVEPYLHLLDMEAYDES